LRDGAWARTPGNGSTGQGVRRARVGDARAMAEITVAGWRAAYAGLMPADFLAGLSVESRERGWRAWLAADEGGDTPAWVALNAGEVVGFAAGGPPRDDDVPAPAAEVYAIYVRPDRWRSGAGRALLGAAAAEWERRGVRTIVLWVLEGNSSGRAFYEAMGWSPDGGRQRLDLGGFESTEVRYRIAIGRPTG
jgi:GNAT superfamily N-acetyltransferase